VSHNSFPSHWDVLPFSQAIKDSTSSSAKIPKGNYLQTGQVPIVDQGANTFGGFTNDLDSKAKVTIPAIIFGDHTRVFKYIDQDFCLGADGAKILEPKVDLDKKFLYYYLQQLRIDSAGYSRHFKFLKEKVVPLPPMTEQKRIAAILDKADAIRRKRHQAIELADEFLRSVFLDMFGDPVVNPKGWEVKPLREIAKIQIGPFGTQLHKEDYISGGVPLINPTHIRDGKIIPNTDLSISADKYSDLPEYHLKEGDIVMGRRGEMGRCATVSKEENGWLCGTGSLYIRPKKAGIFSDYLQRFISSAPVKRHLETEALGATMPNLNKTIVGNILVPVPSDQVLQNFSQIKAHLTKMRGSVEIAKQESLFESLSQKAFTGKL